MVTDKHTHRPNTVIFPAHVNRGLINFALPAVVSGSRDATLRVWNIETGECTKTLSGHVAAVRW